MSPTSMFNCPRAIRSLWLELTEVRLSRYFARRAFADFFLRGDACFAACFAFFFAGFFADFFADFLGGCFDEPFGCFIDEPFGSMISTAGPDGFFAVARRFASSSAIALPRSAGDLTVRAPDLSSARYLSAAVP